MGISLLIFEYADDFAGELSVGDTDKTSFIAWLEDIVANGRIEKFRDEAKAILEWARKEKFNANN